MGNLKQISFNGKASTFSDNIPNNFKDGTGTNSVIEGDVNNNIASGNYSHAEGSGTITSGWASHAEGTSTRAVGPDQHVSGKYNVEINNVAEIIGNGSGNNSRSNARVLDWNGNEKLAGSLTLGMNTAEEITITASELKAIKQMLQDNNYI